MNVESTQRGTIVPTAHSSEPHNMSYSLQATKSSLPNSSPSNLALNFSHDLFLQTGQHSQTATNLHQNSNNADIKPSISNSFDIDSGCLMQSAAVGMNMWKNSMNLNHFKHSTIADHSFLQTPDMNSFSSWPHGGNISHQTSSSVAQHLLDGQHLINYPSQHHHQRSLSIPGHDLMSASLKNQTSAEEASFMLNSINQAPSSSNHLTNHHPHDNLTLKPQPQDHNTASYNLSMNDHQFYNNSRVENRSHQNALKPPLLSGDRSTQMSLNEHHHHMSYQGTHQANLQPTTSNHMAGSSAGGVSKNIGNFKCPHCSEVFNMRNSYQSHLKTHSQEKGSKVKFQCELCGHSFSQKTSLNRHMKSHTGERPFPCDVCGKAFSEKERLKIHMRTHTGEKPFSCGICGKSFSQKSTVKRHQTVHTGEKKFKCDCGKGFANRGNLIAHIKTRGSNHFE